MKAKFLITVRQAIQYYLATVMQAGMDHAGSLGEGDGGEGCVEAEGNPLLAMDDTPFEAPVLDASPVYIDHDLHLMGLPIG